jgi:hypothetical protein
MKSMKKEFLQMLSQIQKKQLLSFLKSFIAKQEILDKNSIYEYFYDEQSYYIEIGRPYFSFMPEVLCDEIFLKDLKNLISEFVFKENQKRIQEPMKQKQKEFAKLQRKKAQEYKMHREKPTPRQVSYYKSLCKKNNQQLKDCSLLSKLEIRDLIQAMIEKNDFSDTI